MPRLLDLRLEPQRMRITEYEWYVARNKGNSVDVDWRRPADQCGNRRRRKHELSGESVSVRQIAERAGLSVAYTHKLLNTMTPQEAIDYAKERGI